VQPAPKLTHGHLTLRLLEERDIGELERGIRDSEIVRWWGAYQGTASELFAKKIREWHEGSLVPLAITDEGRFAGHIFLDLRADQVAVVAYWLLPEARGNGLVTRSLGLLTEWAFDTLGSARIEFWIEPGNAASEATADRAGFTFEGCLRQAGLRDGRRFDKLIYSLLPGDRDRVS